MNYLMIFLGGGLGSVARYFLGLLSLPFPIFWANVAGSFLIGLFSGLSVLWGWPENVRLGLTVGLCGGFTTFSTFSAESLRLFEGGSLWGGLCYIIASVAVCIVAVWCGLRLSSSFVGIPG